MALLYIEDFRRILQELGCLDYRIVDSRRLTIDNAEIQERVGKIKFYSITIRAFKLDIEDRCEDHGQVATYNGGISESPTQFVLDDHHAFEIDRPMLVCGNTADMVSKTRYGKYFTVLGDKSKHFGLFDCGPEASEIAAKDNMPSACC